jgi:xylan 1,4-beta-xylosidase
MESVSQLSCPQPPNRSSTTRRDFLKSSLVSSVAAAAVGIPAVAEESAARAEARTGDPSIISVTGAPPSAPLQKPWKSAIATGHAALLLRADLQQQLAALQRDIGYRYCRFHGIFHDDMAVVARRKDGSLAFRWAQVDKILDALQQLGLRPRVELSPMPIALASGAATAFDWGFNTTPPRDYAEWGKLVGAFARHYLDRYGLEEIAQWYFEVWNEPNMGFWSGSQADYWKLYDASAFALKAVSPRLRVGGPVSAQAGWVAELIEHCYKQHVPLDFISTHIYPMDEWGEYPGLRGSPHQPGHYVADTVRHIRQVVRRSPMPNLEIDWTEWSSLVPAPNDEVPLGMNPSLDEASAAANVCDIAVAVDGECETFCWWEASDIFEEGGMPQSEFSGEYGLLTLNGLPKATLNAFRFLNRLRGGRLELRHEPLAQGCNLVATTEGGNLQILLWCRDLSYYGLVDQGPWTGILEMPWTGTTKPLLLQERITAGAGSCYETWKSLGMPQNLSPQESRVLGAHAVPEAQVFSPSAESGQVTHEFQLARGEVLYIELRSQGEVALPISPLRQELADWYEARRGTKK